METQTCYSVDDSTGNVEVNEVQLIYLADHDLYVEPACPANRNEPMVWTANDLPYHQDRRAALEDARALATSRFIRYSQEAHEFSERAKRFHAQMLAFQNELESCESAE